MIRVTNLTERYVPVTKFNEQRYRINFDKVDLTDELAGLSKWSVLDYIQKPTTEQMQEDVINYTIQRYVDEGLTPPAREDIDVTPYVVD